MDLSYEETMRRIEDYETNGPRFTNGELVHKFCKEKRYPYYVWVYMGEGKIIVNPVITCIGYYSTGMAWHICIPDTSDLAAIGRAAFEGLEHIKVSPVDARTRKEREDDSFIKKSTKCRSYSAFERKFVCCRVCLNEDSTYTAVCDNYSGSYEASIGAYGESIIPLPSDVSAEEMGKVITECLRSKLKYKKTANKPDPYPPVETELLCGKKLKICPPRNSHFIDAEDCSAAEIHQAYEYYSSENAEPSAIFYLGTAAELECNTDENNIKNVWSRLYGEPDKFTVTQGSFGIFQIRIEMRCQKCHRISYITVIDEDELLECTMEVKSPNRRKKTDENLSVMFEKFAGECSFVD